MSVIVFGVVASRIMGGFSAGPTQLDGPFGDGFDGPFGPGFEQDWVEVPESTFNGGDTSLPTVIGVGPGDQITDPTRAAWLMNRVTPAPGPRLALGETSFDGWHEAARHASARELLAMVPVAPELVATWWWDATDRAIVFSPGPAHETSMMAAGVLSKVKIGDVNADVSTFDEVVAALDAAGASAPVQRGAAARMSLSTGSDADQLVLKLGSHRVVLPAGQEVEITVFDVAGEPVVVVAAIDEARGDARSAMEVHLAWWEQAAWSASRPADGLS